MPSIFSPLVEAVLEAIHEGVVVFGADGRVVYANELGRAVLEQVTDGDGVADRLLPVLVRSGARVEPLRVGDLALGEAAYLPVPGADHRTLAERERQAIVETLEATGWRLAESARRLGISRTTLWRRIRAYGLARGRPGWPRGV